MCYALSASRHLLNASFFHHQHQHAYFAIIATIFWNFCGMSDFLEFFFGLGFWNFFSPLRIWKVFIHVAPLTLGGGVYGGGWEGVDTGRWTLLIKVKTWIQNENTKHLSI